MSDKSKTEMSLFHQIKHARWDFISDNPIHPPAALILAPRDWDRLCADPNMFGMARAYDENPKTIFGLTILIDRRAAIWRVVNRKEAAEAIENGARKI